MNRTSFPSGDPGCPRVPRTTASGFLGDEIPAEYLGDRREILRSGELRNPQKVKITHPILEMSHPAWREAVEELPLGSVCI